MLTLYKALKDNKFKYSEVAIEVAMTKTNANKRENHGAI